MEVIYAAVARHLLKMGRMIPRTDFKLSTEGGPIIVNATRLKNDENGLGEERESYIRWRKTSVATNVTLEAQGRRSADDNTVFHASRTWFVSNNRPIKQFDQLEREGTASKARISIFDALVVQLRQYKVGLSTRMGNHNTAYGTRRTEVEFLNS